MRRRVWEARYACLMDGWISHECQMGPLEALGNRHGEVGEVHVLVLGRREVHRRPAKERLHLHATEAARGAIAQDEAGDADHADAVREQFELAVRLAHVVEAHALTDRRPRACGELERAAADGRAVRRVALRQRRNVAHAVVCGELRLGVRWEVSVQLARACGAPHEARGEACRGAASA